MSVFSILTAGIACLATVNAYHAPVGDSPVGNPIYLPGSGSVLPVGQDYTIQWTPTTDGTVSLVLLKGPANNLAVVGPIAEGIPNNGNYTWTPSTDLTAGPTASTGYGIQLIVDATGQYQYTTQFGISNDHSSQNGWASASASWPSSWSASATSWPSDSLTAYSASAWSSSTTSSTDASSTTATDSSSTDSATETTSWAEITTAPAMTTTPVTMATSTVSSKLSSSSKSASATTSAPVATSTGGAASLKAGVLGLVAVAGAAIFAF